MVPFILDNGTQESEMALEIKLGLTVADMKDIGRPTKQMAKESLFMLTATSTKVNG